jgi:hypothetical protein
VSKNLQRALLVVFILVDIVLIGGAIRHVNGTPPESDMPDPASASASPSPTPSTQEVEAQSAQVDYRFRASSAVALSSANDGTIVYGPRGRCSDEDAEVMVSTNKGADFSASKTGLSTTLAVKTTGAELIAVVGTDADCKARQVTSTDGGKTWKESDSIDLWYPAPEDTKEVVSPDGASTPSTKCDVLSVGQVTGESARVSCADGTFRGTGDSGKTWVELGRLDNVRASSFSSPSKGYALARYNGCGANAFSTADGGASWTPGGCISGDPAQAIAATTNALTAVVADDPYVSTDDGKTWMQP